MVFGDHFTYVVQNISGGAGKTIFLAPFLQILGGGAGGLDPPGSYAYDPGGMVWDGVSSPNGGGGIAGFCEATPWKIFENHARNDAFWAIEYSIKQFKFLLNIIK